MAFLIAGLTVMAVVDHQDRQIGRVENGNRCQRSKVHQQLAVAGQHHDPPVATRQCKAQTHHAGPAHGPGHAIDVGAIRGQSRNIPRRAGKPSNEQEILMAADQGGYRLEAIEPEGGSKSARHARQGGRIWHVVSLKISWRQAVSA
jgi:hypothetical protein